MASLLAVQVSAYAQPCPIRPADCPERNFANADLTEDSISRMHNPLVPEEVSMEFRLRWQTGEFVRQLASSQHWQEPVELTEWGTSGFRLPNSEVMPFSQRPPHVFGITWEIIVNKDSLTAWANWTNEMGERLKTMMSQSFQASSTPSDQQKAIKDMAAFDRERKMRNIQFREATVLLFQFDFNMDKAYGIKGKPVGDLAVPGCALVRRYENPEPDITDALHSYMHSANVALVLVGSWNTKLTANGYEGFFESPFYQDKKGRDLTSPKKVGSDQVRGLCLYLSGNKAGIQKILSGRSLEPLQKWIVSSPAAAP
jgi:hypothetical protein